MFYAVRPSTSLAWIYLRSFRGDSNLTTRRSLVVPTLCVCAYYWYQDLSVLVARRGTLRKPSQRRYVACESLLFERAMRADDGAPDFHILLLVRDSDRAHRGECSVVCMLHTYMWLPRHDNGVVCSCVCVQHEHTQCLMAWLTDFKSPQLR